MPLGRSEPDLLVAPGDASGGQVDGEVLRHHHRDVRGRRSSAAYGGAEAGEELVQPEGLGDVVVGAGVQRRDRIALVLAGRQDQDRYVGPAAQALQDLQSVEVGQAEVQDDDVGCSVACKLQGGPAGEGDIDVVAART